MTRSPDGIVISVHRPLRASVPDREALTASIPLPLEWCRDVSELALMDEAGDVCPLQARVLESWPGGAARWVRITGLVRIAATDSTWRVVRLSAPPTADVSLSVEREAGGLVVRTGATTFHVAPSIERPVSRQAARPRDLLSLVLQGSGGERWAAGAARLAVEESGPLTASLVLTGILHRGSKRLEIDWRLRFYARVAGVEVSLVVRNPHRARHPEGYWDLGDAGSIGFQALGAAVRAGAGGRALLRSEPDTSFRDCGRTFELAQTTSGGDLKSPVHVRADGSLPEALPGYRAVTELGGWDGKRATPVVVQTGAEGAVAIAVPEFWQNFPKAIEADSGTVTLRLFPASDRPHELQGGEQKTHRFVIAVAGEPSAAAAVAESLAWPAMSWSGASAYEAAGAVRAVPVDADRAAAWERLVAPALAGDASFERKRERIDEYGWRHFGDLYADHEAVRQLDPVPLVSHYNNQYDAVAGFAQQFMRTGDLRWWRLMDELARHVIDIDIYHTGEDRAAYSGGLFWHTNHYVPAHTATHRAYSRHAGLPGGGPSCEHNYTTGLLWHHMLTGSPASREAVLGLARWVIAMDDGARSRFRWIDRGPTGLASATYSADYHGPGRGAANSIVALLDAHRLAGDDAFLDKAHEIIRRCIHPDDDPSAHDLLDAERRWSYTVFLQALLRYLEHRGAVADDMTAYVGASLVRYAGWMATHEVPYLDRSERLEFPTETWVAQDLRKADVLLSAAVLALPEVRGTLEARGRFFADYAFATLSRMPTATCTRPLVLLLTQGPSLVYGRNLPPVAPAPFRAWPNPRPFVPQLERVKRRLVYAGAAGAVVATLLAVGWISGAF